MVKMFCLFLSLLLGWTEGEVLCHCFTESNWRVLVCSTLIVCTDSPVNKTQSRRQSGLVCSLLVVSLLLSTVVGGEGELSEVFTSKV